MALKQKKRRLIRRFLKEGTCKLLGLEGGTGLKFYGLRRLDLELFTRTGIKSRAGLAVDNGECAETYKLKLLVLLYPRLNGVEDGFKRLFCACLRRILAKRLLDFKY